MRKLVLLLIVFNSLHNAVQAQLASLSEKRNDTLLEKRIRKIILADNQFFNIDNKDAIILFNIVPENSLIKKDSLLEESKYLYNEILNTIGKERANENVDIAYIGQQTDKNNIGFTYKDNRYRGQVSYGNHDTLLAPDNNVKQQLNKLDGNKYVRHIIDRNGLTIVFTVISKDLSSKEKAGEGDAVKFLSYYLQKQFCLYNRIHIIYLDRYGDGGIRYEASVAELILNNLKAKK